MKIPCEIDNIKTLKKGMKITLNIAHDDVRKVMADIHNFMDKPVIVDVNVNSNLQLERLNQISEEQRKKIYSIIKDIANHIGDSNDSMKLTLKNHFIQNSHHQDFSLSNCTNETAKDFIEFLINFAYENGITIQDQPTTAGTNDTDSYLRACVTNKTCAVCGEEAKVYGKDTKIALCDNHAQESIKLGADRFLEKYHVYPI